MTRWRRYRYLVWFTGLGMTAISCVLFDSHHYLPGIILWLVAVAETVSFALAGTVMYRRQQQNISGQ